MTDIETGIMIKNMAREMVNKMTTTAKNLRTYAELSKDLQEIAREKWPDDYEEREYKTAGVLIEWSAK